MLYGGKFFGEFVTCFSLQGRHVLMELSLYRKNFKNQMLEVFFGTISSFDSV